MAFLTGALLASCSDGAHWESTSNEDEVTEESETALVTGRDTVISARAPDTPVLSSLTASRVLVPGSRVILTTTAPFGNVGASASSPARTRGPAEFWPHPLVPSKITIDPVTRLPSFPTSTGGVVIHANTNLAPGTAGSVGAAPQISVSALPFTAPRVTAPAGATKVRVRMQLSSSAAVNMALASISLQTRVGTTATTHSVFNGSSCSALAPAGAWTGTGSCLATAVKPATDAAGLTTWDIALPAGTTDAQLSLRVGINSLSTYPGFFDLVFLDAANLQIGSPLGATWPILVDSGGHMAVNMDPRYGETPTRIANASGCTRSGSGPVADPAGKIDCYPLIVQVPLVTYDARLPVPGVSASSPNWPHLATAMLAVDNSGANPVVSSFAFDSPLRAMTYPSGATTKPMRGFEITSTADSRLMIYEDHEGLRHVFTFSATPWDATSYSAPLPITQLPQSTITFCLDGTNTCPTKVKLTDYYPLARATWKMPDGTPLANGEKIICAYPWISFDGANLFCRVLRRSGYAVIGSLTNHIFRHIDGPLNRLRDNQQPGCEKFTSPMSQGNLCPGPTRSNSFGMDHGLWGTFPDMPNSPLPYTRRGPTWTILQADNQGGMDGTNLGTVYAEVPFHDSMDGHYLAYLRMNESFTFGSYSDAYWGAGRTFAYDDTRTPDTSGNLNTGTLRGGAMFPFAYNKSIHPAQTVTYTKGGAAVTAQWNKNWDWFDTANPGRIGRAVFFPEGSDVLLTNSSTLNPDRGKLTVEMFVRPMVDLVNAAPGTNNWRFLISKTSSYDIILEASRRIQASVFLRNPTTNVVQRVRTQIVGPQLPIGSWSHIAMTYDKDDSVSPLRVYVNGTLVTSGNAYINNQLVTGGIAGWGPVLGSTGDVQIGPGVGRTYAASLTSAGVLFALDELAISDIARSPQEIAAAAYVPTNDTFQTATISALGSTAPLGLASAEVRVPAGLAPLLTAGTLSSYAAIGKDLFADANLSRNAANVSQNVSCTTCHLDSKAGTDGKPLAIGVGVSPLNSPTTLNRAFSTYQFFDGRAKDLVTQALEPLAAPHEMNANINAVLSYVNSVASGYPARFAAIPGFSGAITKDVLAQALAAHMIRQLSGDAPADRLVANVALPASISSSVRQRLVKGFALFNGKARCVACHMGSNFSDELFHNTGTANQATDLGRGAVDSGRMSQHAFKTSMLRNLALTAPYFHDGSRSSLAAVIDFYDCGGVDPVGGVCPATRTTRGELSTEMLPLGLTTSEKQDLELFLACGLLDTTRFGSSLASVCK